MVEQAQAALKKGLAGLALDLLLAADLNKEPGGAPLLLELLLATGRAREVGPEIPRSGEGETSPGWSRMQFLLHSALGNYQLADEFLRQYPLGLPLAGVREPLLPRDLIGMQVAGALGQALALPGQPVVFPLTWGRHQFAVEILMGELKREDDLETLRGLLALETGQADLARQRFQQALRQADRRGGAAHFPARRLARHYLQRIEASAVKAKQQ